MIKPELDNEQAAIMGARYLNGLEYGGRLAIQVTHTSKSNLSYRFKVWIAYPDLGNTELENISYWLGAVTGHKVTEQHEIKGSGYGFSRYFDGVCRVAHALRLLGLSNDERLQYNLKFTEL